ncbi:YdcF family protein [Arcanobacterium canis]|uniref:YdcF family protein n=1 Tax=Arcanobacterium canis TaxID=999183 RepID=A0ABY8FZI1_9ACTO|nr:YdcF family protein [Arcanobacterium canis]WFM83935.1 YdcF family protein [Arcanobacterium canis]
MMDEGFSGFLVVLGIGIIVLGWGIARLIRDRRRPATGLWLLSGGLLTWIGLAAVVSLVSPALGLIMFYGLFLGGFVLAMGLSLLLIANGYYVMKRHGVNLTRALPLVAGAGTFLATVLIVYFHSSVFLHLLDSNSGWADVRLITVAFWYILVVGYIGFNLVAYTLQAWIHSLWPREERYDVVVVLGAGLIGDRVTALLSGRLDRGIGIAREAGARVIVCSGGQGSDEKVSEAEAMSRYVREVSGNEFTVLKEERSTTTAENLLLTRALLTKVGADRITDG